MRTYLFELQSNSEDGQVYFVEVKIQKQTLEDYNTPLFLYQKAYLLS